jgi:hypothetical protein
MDWQVFPGFILNNVGIMLDLAMSNNSKCGLWVRKRRQMQLIRL